MDARLPAELAPAELERILRSSLLARSERLSRFLCFVVEQTLPGQADDLKESVLAVEVFDLPPTYDSRVQSIVRVQASRLREKLEKYYQTEGLSSEVRIELPKGGYVPRIRRRAPAPAWRANLVAYASNRTGEGGLDIWVQPLAGGQPVRLTDNPGDDFDPDFSAEGCRIAYWVGEKHFRSAHISLVSSAGGKPVPLVPEFPYAAYPVWSCDGRKILFAGNSGRDGEVWDWRVAPADGGPAIKAGAQEIFQKHGISGSDRRRRARGIAPSAWMRDQGVLFSARSGRRTNVWRIRIPAESGGAAYPCEQLTSSAGREDYLSSASEDRVRLSVLAEKSHLWSLPLDPASGKPAGRNGSPSPRPGTGWTSPGGLTPVTSSISCRTGTARSASGPSAWALTSGPGAKPSPFGTFMDAATRWITFEVWSWLSLATVSSSAWTNPPATSG